MASIHLLHPIYLLLLSHSHILSDWSVVVIAYHIRIKMIKSKFSFQSGLSTVYGSEHLHGSEPFRNTDLSLFVTRIWALFENRSEHLYGFKSFEVRICVCSQIWSFLPQNWAFLSQAMSHRDQMISARGRRRRGKETFQVIQPTQLLQASKDRWELLDPF